MKSELIGVPLYYGCDNPGTERAYDTFINNNLAVVVTSAGAEVSQTHRVCVPPLENTGSAPKTPSCNPNEVKYEVKYLKEVLKTCANLEQAVDACLSRGNFPFVIGGDHSLGVGSIAGVRHHCSKEELTVIWVDAHTDINTPMSSASHNAHGMPLSGCLKLDAPTFYEGVGKIPPPFLLPENLFYLGSRSVDPGEWEILRQLKIVPFTMEEISRIGIKQATQQMLAKVKTPWIHVSFDVDFMDGKEYSATGLPVPNGPSVSDTILCLKEILSDNRVRSMDFVEYSPGHDTNESGLDVCMNLIKTCFQTLSHRTSTQD